MVTGILGGKSVNSAWTDPASTHEFLPWQEMTKSKGWNIYIYIVLINIYIYIVYTYLYTVYWILQIIYHTLHITYIYIYIISNISNIYSKFLIYKIIYHMQAIHGKAVSSLPLQWMSTVSPPYPAANRSHRSQLLRQTQSLCSCCSHLGPHPKPNISRTSLQLW